ncbi:hypothetical protein RFI_26143 [Reticulomyxa filosa]|uniref:Transmembrane protein n=1 Tax=Reticulomyxa filosa TaxID=46433 RepID=X6MC32_RETFI|nr:hypothetical protein RFI_26143 [Reticulomyxa filosa]|eukprot:ETO11231.1 hypothetical protein RFI_26143 [Reticulomyxa filosa]
MYDMYIFFLKSFEKCKKKIIFVLNFDLNQLLMIGLSFVNKQLFESISQLGNNEKDFYFQLVIIFVFAFVQMSLRQIMFLLDTNLFGVDYLSGAKHLDLSYVSTDTDNVAGSNCGVLSSCSCDIDNVTLDITCGQLVFFVICVAFDVVMCMTYILLSQLSTNSKKKIPILDKYIIYFQKKMHVSSY